MSKHAELIARLEAAGVGEHALNVAFRDAIGIDCGPVTTSLDAAIALAERVLPDYWWLIRSDDDEARFFANLGLIGTSPNMGAECYPVFCRTPALAICCAILKALEDKA